MSQSRITSRRGRHESGVTVDQCVGSANGGGSTSACAPTAEYDQCHRDAVQHVGLRRGHVCRRADRRLHRDGRGNGRSCDRQPVQRDRDRWWQRSDLHGHVADVFTAATTTPTSAPAGTGGTVEPVEPLGRGASWCQWRSALGGGSGGAVGAGGSTGVAGASGTVAAVIPTGAPQTGFGGASESTDPALVSVGGAALAAAGLTMALTIRRRRRQGVTSLQSHVS